MFQRCCSSRTSGGALDMAILHDRAEPCIRFRHTWWINHRLLWLNCKLVDGKPIGAKPTVAILLSILLDRRSLDFHLWLGWLGFRLWWRAPQWWTSHTTSGLSLWWGREPIVEGARFIRYEFTREFETT